MGNKVANESDPHYDQIKSLTYAQLLESLGNVKHRLDLPKECPSPPSKELLQRFLERKKNRILILSCDGGGTRAVSPSQFLTHLEETLGLPLHETFDMFCGCSIGSVLAMGIGASKKSARTLLDICCDREGVWSKVMPRPKNLVGPRYPAEGKFALLDSILGDIKFSDVDKMLVVPAYSLTLEETCIFDENYGDLSIRDVTDASSAAPTIFPSICIDNNWYVDGGVTCCDPALCGWVKAVSKFGFGADIRIISVSTGKRKDHMNGEEAQNHGIFGWLTNDLIEITLNDSLVQKHLYTLLGPKYIRVQTKMEECGVKQEIDDYTEEQFESLKKMGSLWWEKFGQDVLDLILLEEDELQLKFKAKAEQQQKALQEQLQKAQELASQSKQTVAVPQPTAPKNITSDDKAPRKRISEDPKDENSVEGPFKLHHNLPDQNFARSPSLTRLRTSSRSEQNQEK